MIYVYNYVYIPNILNFHLKKKIYSYEVGTIKNRNRNLKKYT